MEELISVIVPVYNTIDYIDECIKSVLGQSYKTWEMILVDDGSTDGSSEKCDYYQQYDNRIKVIHQKNGGQSKARNVALKYCSGAYYMFLDSDDRLAKEAMYLLYSTVKKYEADICFAGIKQFDEKKEKNVYTSDTIQLWNGKDACKKMFLQDGIDSNTFAKIYKAELWSGVFFPEGVIFEDVPVMYKLVLKSNKVVQGNFCVYEQRSRSGSTTKSEFNEKKKIYTEVTRNVYLDIEETIPELKEAAYIYYVYSVVDNFINLSCSKSIKKFYEYWKELRKIIADNFVLILRQDVFKSRKLRVLCCYFGLGEVATSCIQLMRQIIK